MPNINISVIDKTNLPGKMREILSGAKKGVKIATESGAEWIVNDVFLGQEFVGDELFPDVTPETKLQKAKAGKTLVGKNTGNLIAEFDTDYLHDGLSGIITGGGGKAEAYSGRFFERWQVAPLFMREMGEKSRELIRSEIKKGI